MVENESRLLQLLHEFMIISSVSLLKGILQGISNECFEDTESGESLAYLVI
jgi:hypothetical protein